MPGPLNAPPSYVDDQGRRIVFAKVSLASYLIAFDEGQQQAIVTSTIDFTTLEEGFPVIDLHVEAAEQITSVALNGLPIATAETAAPQNVTDYRILTPANPLPPNSYRVVMKHELRAGVQWGANGVTCSFELHDREEPYTPLRQRAPFLERYLPCNLEFDQHPVELHVKVTAANPHQVFTNAQSQIALAGGNNWIFTYPSTYCSSSMFFVLTPAADVLEHSFVHDGLPVTIFSTTPGTNPQAFELPTKQGLNDLINGGFGAFPHASLLLHATEDEGMEYVAAAAVSAGSLRHELVHQYVGRCLQPVNGDAGWFDEGVASWFEFGKLAHTHPPGDASNIGERSPYHRVTDRRSWTQGKVMISYLHKQLLPKGGIPALIRHLLNEGGLKFKPRTARQFQGDLESFAERSFAAEFDRAIYQQPLL